MVTAVVVVALSLAAAVVAAVVVVLLSLAAAGVCHGPYL